jgi:hypothetical protein
LHSALVENKRRAVRLAEILKKYNDDLRVTVIASLNIDSIDLRDNDSPLQELVNQIPNKEFASIVNIGHLSAREKQKIYNQYELKLNDDREVAIQDVADVLNITEGFSNTEYLSYLLSYMKSSLLSYGKFIPIEAYQELSLAQNNYENSPNNRRFKIHDG